MGCRNVTDGISLIKFCDNLSDLTEFNLDFAIDAASKIEDEIVDDTSDSLPMDERRSPTVDVGNVTASSSGGVNGEKEAWRRAQHVMHHVVFVIKLDAVNSSALSPQEMIRNVWRKNQSSKSSNIWSLAIVYVGL